MRDEINLQIARRRHLPVIRLDGDLVLEQRARPRRAVEPPFEPLFPVPQPTIDRPRTDPLKLRS